VRLDTLKKVTEEFGYLEAIGETAQKMATKLRTLWTPEVDEMPYYPAFENQRS
jgi:hypothetical protein